MELSQLRYFQMIAKYENMSRAAETLYVSQPNLSISIAKLESELGVTLFDRKNGKVHLNANGRQFLLYVDQSLGALDAGVRSLAACENDNMLSLASTASVNQCLSRFLKQHPEVSLRHRMGDLFSVTDGLLKEELDVAITSLPPLHSSVDFQKFFLTDYILLLGKNHPLTVFEKVSFTQLQDVRFVFDVTRTDILLAIGEFRKYGISLHIDYEVQDLDVLCSMVTENDCVALLPRTSFQEAVLNGYGKDILFREIVEETPQAYWGFATKKGRKLSENATILRNFVQEYFTSIGPAYEELVLNRT